MKRLTITIISCLLALLSCTKEARELEYSKQETLIEKFINSQLSKYPDARTVLNGGVTRLVLGEGEGLELNSRGTAEIRYSGYNFSTGTLSDKTLFVTNDESVATSCKWNISRDNAWEPIRISLTDKDIIEGIRKGLEGVRKGEEALILFSGKYGFGKSGIGTIPANAPLAFQISVLDIEN